MPGGDGTGPWGRGSRTGWGLGYCGDPYGPRYPGPRGRGFGNGRRWFFDDVPDRSPPGPPNANPTFREPSRNEEKSYLEGLVRDLETELEGIKKRIEELNVEKDE